MKQKDKQTAQATPKEKLKEELTQLEKQMSRQIWNRINSASFAHALEHRITKTNSTESIISSIAPYANLSIVHTIKQDGPTCDFKYTFEDLPSQTFEKIIGAINPTALLILKGADLTGDKYPIQDASDLKNFKEMENILRGTGIDTAIHEFSKTIRMMQNCQDLIFPDVQSLSVFVESPVNAVFYRYINSIQEDLETPAEEKKEQSKYVLALTSRPHNLAKKDAKTKQTNYPLVKEMNIPSTNVIFRPELLQKYLSKNKQHATAILESIASYNETIGSLSHGPIQFIKPELTETQAHSRGKLAEKITSMLERIYK